MATLHAQLATARGLRWISEFERGRVLHLFERSANLANQRGEVLSIVDAEIGPGPFNLVLKNSLDFKRFISPASEIRFEFGTLKAGDEGTLKVGTTGTLRVGELAILLDEVEIWDPVPPWRSIGADRLAWLVEAIESEMQVSPVRPAIDFAQPDPPPDPEDRAAMAAFAGRLAGLGPGLTPSGDDVLMGLIHAYFVRYPLELAAEASRVVAQTAAGRTTSLSAAWLNAAAVGEAGHLWHGLVAAATSAVAGLVPARSGTGRAQGPPLREAIRAILAVGHTSGADALAGFVAGLAQSDGRPQAPPLRLSV